MVFSSELPPPETTEKKQSWQRTRYSFRHTWAGRKWKLDSLASDPAVSLWITQKPEENLYDALEKHTCKTTRLSQPRDGLEQPWAFINLRFNPYKLSGVYLVIVTCRCCAARESSVHVHPPCSLSVSCDVAVSGTSEKCSIWCSKEAVRSSGDKPNLPFQRVCLTQSMSPDGEQQSEEELWGAPRRIYNLTFWVAHVSYKLFTFVEAGLFLPEPDPSLDLGAHSLGFFLHVNTFLPEVYEHAVVHSRFSKTFRACISNVYRSPHCGLWKEHGREDRPESCPPSLSQEGLVREHDYLKNKSDTDFTLLWGCI